LDNPTCFTNPFQFEITFECLQELDDDLEWKVLYVGSAQDAAKDQILDEILVGPVPVGVNKFVLQADAPDPSQLAQDDLLGVTVVLVTCSYKEREFVRVGYYVNNEYHDPNAPAPAPPAAAAVGPDGTPLETTPAPPQIPNPVPLEHIQRQILADKPRVTKFPISWGDEPAPATANNAGTANNTTSTSSNSASANSTGAAMMADHASAMMTGAALAAPAMTVTPPGIAIASGNHDHDTGAMEEEDIMDDEELSVDEEGETGDVSTSGHGIVSMPEESNMSHAYFANSSSNNNNNNGVQAMAE
jgi:histone chaperone ASF1